MAGLVYTATSTVTDADDQNSVLVTFTNANTGTGAAALTFTATLVYDLGAGVTGDRYIISTPEVTALAAGASETFTMAVGTATYVENNLHVGVAFTAAAGT